jgi:hypothetical protein
MAELDFAASCCTISLNDYSIADFIPHHESPSAEAFRLPFGAPGEGPPWVRHLPFGIAGD